MTDVEQIFRAEQISRINANADNSLLREASNRFLVESIRSSYSYNFDWLSRPIIQYPQDIVAMQELIWRIRPDLIIETGIAHGGSLIMSASMLALIDYCDAVAARKTLDPNSTLRRVLGIDIDIRPHNRAAIEAHPMAHRIDMIQGSSIDVAVIARVRDIAKNYKCVMVCLDSNHTHNHVIAELEAYAPLVTMGSYCIVFDTVIEQLPDSTFTDRPWSRGNNPMTAVHLFLSSTSESTIVAGDGERLCFDVDATIDSKLLISVAPGGYLHRVPHASCIRSPSLTS